MRNFKITLLFLCIIGSYAAQSQNPYWALNSLRKLDQSTNAVTPLSGAVNTCGTANSKGLFDASGNPVFYVNHNRIYNKNGGIAHTIPGAPYCVKGIHIVPVPGGSCGEYYVIYAKVAELGAFPNGGAPYDGYEIGAIKVTVDANQNISVSTTSKVTYADFPLVIHTNIETALSKESNGERTLYVTFRRSANPNINTDQLVKIKVQNTGLSKNGGFFPGTGTQTLNTSTLEISPDQTSLAWVQAVTYNSYAIRVMNLANNTTTDISIPNLSQNSDIEFGANSNDIYATTTQGVVSTSLSNPSAITPIAGTSAIHYGGDIELGTNNRLYVTATNNGLYLITGSTASVVNFYASKYLPEQVDGETIQYAPPAPLTVYLSITITGFTRASVAGGSGNYTYAWYNSFGGQVATGNDARLCGKGRHSVVVRDVNSGCSTTYVFENYPIPGCRSTSSEIKIGGAEVKAYPNPASNHLNIQTSREENIVQLKVTNFQGKMLMQVEGSQRSNQRISTNGLKPGMYILDIVTDKSNRQVKFVVK